MRALSNVMRREPRMAVASDIRSASRVRKVSGMRARPRMAGKSRIITYGTAGLR